MKKYIFLVMFCMFNQVSYTEQFVYPVTSFDDGNQLMILCQKSLDDIELWILNTNSNIATKGLSSFLTPANLRMLPSGKGFSFIDQGYIKIKEFMKRSPRTLPIYEPIGLFSSMNWIDDETFYFVARQGNYFQIFQGSIEANIQQITDELTDSLYPQKIGSQLFYMNRDNNNQISIVTKPWTLENNKSNDLIILQEPQQQLCFLKMINELEGFYIEAPTQKIKNVHECYEFICHHFFKQNNQKWISEKAFTFKVPSSYITGPDRLYESLEPFLPNYTNYKSVHFCDWDNALEQFQLYAYNTQTKQVINITEDQAHKKKSVKIFAPYSYKDIIYCGIILNEKKSNPTIFELDNEQIQLPVFIVK